MTRGQLTRQGKQLVCPDSGFEGELVDNVAVMMASSHRSYFDDKYEVMRDGHESEGEHRFCYEQQMALLKIFLTPGMIALDVGCGPALPYQKPKGVKIIGLDRSLHSIRENRECDLLIFGSALAIPLPDKSMDAVICVYSIHHMVGKTIAETRSNVKRAFLEFGRVLKPGGMLLVFEMTPFAPFALFQQLGWNLLRRLMPNKLDMYFWKADAIIEMARQTLPEGSQVEKVFFGTSAFTTFPPAFSLPWLRIPRLLYPLDAKLYKWHTRPE